MGRLINRSPPRNIVRCGGNFSHVVLLSSLLFFGQMFPFSQAQTTSPEIRLELHLCDCEIPSLQDRVKDFAALEEFNLTDVGVDLPPKDGREPFYIVLNKEEKIEILLTDFLRKNQIFIAFYELQSTPDFEPLTEKFVSMLEEAWPGMLHPHNGE